MQKDFKKAVYWFTKAAEQDNVNSVFSLAGLYETGTGVPQDKMKALQLYSKAAEMGDKEAQLKVELLSKPAADNTATDNVAANPALNDEYIENYKKVLRQMAESGNEEARIALENFEKIIKNIK